MTWHSFAPQPLHRADTLALTIMSLDDWALSSITGIDSTRYLHGQLTADILKFSQHQHVMAAHCDAKGKMWSAMHLFRHGDGFSWIERRSLQATQLAELKKYAVFSKVSIQPDDHHLLLGVAGNHARRALAGYFQQLPDAHTPLIQQDTSTLLWFGWPLERFLIVTDEPQVRQLSQQLQSCATFSDSNQWLALDIEAGYPVLEATTSGQFLPQACNLQIFGGISFKKGCYTGQEMVSRAKFRGANKRALWCLHGNASRLPAPGENLEMQLNDHWRRTGTVLAAVRLQDKSLLVQAVFNNDIPPENLFRVRDSNADNLHIVPLPYSLQEEAI